MEQLHITVHAGDTADFHNRADYCVGTGRLGLALHGAYQQQLQAVQALCGFQHIRGHGLFSDDMAICQPWTDEDGQVHEGYCFTYLDRVVDAWRAAGLKPFLELGFMPKHLASGTQTVFYWQGNVTPPKDYDRWAALIQATLTHLAKRYGADEVSTWPCEVWNEPNLTVFWKDADRAEYLRLYAASARAVKAVLPAMPVGGPAVCGGNDWEGWMRDFLAFCQQEQLPLDFVSRHHYMAGTPTRRGPYTYHDMCTVRQLTAEVQRTRELIDSFPAYRGLPLHITEFNTSYNPRCPLHDTVRNAAITAGLLGTLGDWADSYSYWTFGDVFEETGVPKSPFHGGFGLMANGCIPKPTMWVYHFFHRLKGSCVHRDDRSVICRLADGSCEGVLWQLPEHDPCSLQITLPGEGRMALVTRTVAKGQGDPLQCWLNLGQPANPTAEEEALLQASAQPAFHSQVLQAEGGQVAFSLPMDGCQVSWFRLCAAEETPDRGYDPAMYL